MPLYIRIATPYFQIMSNDNKHPNETVIDVDSIKHSNINSFDLPEGLPERAKDVHGIIRDVSPMDFDKFLNTFRADADPEGEMQVWEAIAAAYGAFVQLKPHCPLATRKDAFTDILRESLSGGVVIVER